MLGINNKRTPVSGIFAKEMRDALERVGSRTPNAAEREAQRRMKVARAKYDIEWK